VHVTLVPSATGEGSAEQQFLTTLLINDTVAIDAGSLGLYGRPAQQAQVKHLLLSHSHIDHLASLPIFLDTVYRGDGDCPTLYAGDSVLDCLRRDLFNNRVWPDFIGFSATQPPYLKLQRIEPGQALIVDGLRVTPVEVNHVVPTLGFVVEDAHAAVVFTSDTGPTEVIWEHANRLPHLKAVFMEVTFPDELAWLADRARHLTPALFAREAQKVKRPVTFLAVHIHSRQRAAVVEQLQALALPNLQITGPGVRYSF
jgi:ribonuclease BN (tRNA processing enzyme)